jgi:predicted aspartyl protease
VNASFSAKQGPIYIEAEISGPTGRSSLRLLLDTGATTSLIDPVLLTAIGYDPASSPDRVRVTMGGGAVMVPRVVVNRLTLLGQHRIGFALLSYPLPPEAGVDGLLGLDFLRGQILTLDFRSGLISLA